jgi:hypothetical protein
MALTGPGCGHESRPGVPYCTVCGAVRPEPDAAAASEPGPPPRWGSPEFYAQTAPAYQPAPVYQAAPVQQPPPARPVAPSELALYQPPAPPQSPPQASPQAPPQAPGRRPRPRPGRPRLRGVLIGLVTFLAAAAVAAAVMLIAHPAQRGTPAAPASSAPPTGTPSSSAAQITRAQAAQGLATLLAQSVTDRSSIVAAANDISQCGPNLRQDPQAFQAAATSRQNLLGQLASLPGRSALSATMLTDLTSAWQNSIKADQDYARWAQDEMSKGCTANNESDPNAQAVVGPDNQATIDKKAFVSAWNPVATRYGLSTYQWNQL